MKIKSRIVKSFRKINFMKWLASSYFYFYFFGKVFKNKKIFFIFYPKMKLK